jgi:cytochrome c6
MESMTRPIWICAVLLSAASTCVAQSSGETTYSAQCEMCHGESGAGDTPVGKALQAKSLTASETAKKSDAALAAAIKNGSGKMPAFKDKLTDTQINDVIAYIRKLEKK